nr:sugar ABC transporter permease [Bacillus licheniformis]
MIRAIVRKWEGYFYLFPAVLFMLALIGYPLIYNMILSFQNVSLANIASHDISFIGIENYQRLAQDKVFWASLKNTPLYTAGSVVFQFAIGFLLALFFSMKFRLAPFLRGLMMVSWLIPLTVTALLFKFMMASNEGVFNQSAPIMGNDRHPDPLAVRPEYGHLVRYHRQHLGRHSF